MGDYIDGQLLINQIKNGQHSSFRLLFDSYYRRLYAYALKFVDEDEAHDIVQDLFSVIWEKKEQLDIKSSLTSYLFAGIRNNCLQLIEKKKVRMSYQAEKSTLLTLDEINFFDSDSVQSIIELELREKIEDIISKLPEQCQRVFILSRIKRVRNVDIAEQLNISPKTVEKHLSKALCVMREELKDYLPFILFILS